MADTVTSQVLINGNRNLVMKFTNVSDGTGESAVKKVDAQSATYAVNGIEPGVHLTIVKIIYNVNGGEVEMLWEATANTTILNLNGYSTDDYGQMGGLTNPDATGATGSILFTTHTFVAGSGYTVTMFMRKNV